jgi:hypothetical protein
MRLSGAVYQGGFRVGCGARPEGDFEDSEREIRGRHKENYHKQIYYGEKRTFHWGERRP